MSDQFKKFLILFPSLGVAVGVFWLLWYLLGVFLSGSGEPCYGCVVFVPIFFIPSIACARIFYLFLVKKIILNKYQNSMYVQEDVQGKHENTHSYFFYSLVLAIIQTGLFFYRAFELGSFGILLMLFMVGLGFVFWPFIFNKEISFTNKLMFSVLFFFSPIIVATVASFLFVH